MMKNNENARNRTRKDMLRKTLEETKSKEQLYDRIVRVCRNTYNHGLMKEIIHLIIKAKRETTFRTIFAKEWDTKAKSIGNCIAGLNSKFQREKAETEALVAEAQSIRKAMVLMNRGTFQNNKSRVGKHNGKRRMKGDEMMELLNKSLTMKDELQECFPNAKIHDRERNKCVAEVENIVVQLKASLKINIYNFV